MRSAQRIVLALGALAILAVVDMSPRVSVYQGSILRDTGQDSQLAVVIDVRSVGIYVGAIAAATALFWLALNAKRDDTLKKRMDGFEQTFEARGAEFSRDIRALEAHLTEPETPAP
jgi:predicted hotdog family 3-hydroxylacyl-ACP dehydratase